MARRESAAGSPPSWQCWRRAPPPAQAACQCLPLLVRSSRTPSIFTVCPRDGLGVRCFVAGCRALLHVLMQIVFLVGERGGDFLHLERDAKRYAVVESLKRLAGCREDGIARTLARFEVAP